MRIHGTNIIQRLAANKSIKCPTSHWPETYPVVLNLVNPSHIADNWKGKLVGSATDGASVMLGENGGVVKRVMDIVGRTYIQSVHCSAHRLELAYRDVSMCVRPLICTSALTV